jgi:hypothetical protein
MRIRPLIFPLPFKHTPFHKTPLLSKQHCLLPQGDGDGEDEEDSEAPLEAEDDQYLKKLQRAARDILGGGDGGEEDDDDGEDDWSDEEEACSTPLEELEPYGHLVEAVAGLQVAMPARYAAVVAGADAGVQEGLRALHAHAESERQRRQ